MNVDFAHVGGTPGEGTEKDYLAETDNFNLTILSFVYRRGYFRDP